MYEGWDRSNGSIMEVRENSNYMYGVQDKQKHNQPTKIKLIWYFFIKWCTILYTYI